MSLDLIVVTLPLGSVLILAFLATRRRRKQRRQRQQRGLRWLEALRKMLDLLQQHRGLSTGYLNGSTSLLTQIKQLQAHIRDTQAQIIGVHASIQQNDRWQALSEHWARLTDKFRSLSTPDNLRQHNQLIQSLLYLIDDIAQQTDLLLLKNTGDQPLILAWRELLTAVECVGQARAVGTGAVAAGQCDTITRIRLNYLYQKIERTCSLAWETLPPSALQRTRVESLLTCIQEELLGRARPTLEVKAYFNTASDAVASLYEQYDHLVADFSTSGVH